MWEITREFEISVAHYLRGYEGSCSRLHGHGIVGEVTLIGDDKNAIGIVFDLRDLQLLIEKVIINPLDHQCLNDVLPFNPTMENLSKHIYKNIQTYLYDHYLDNIKVKEVVLKESSKSKIKYYEPDGEGRSNC